jgi:hypothetical protein
MPLRIALALAMTLLTWSASLAGPPSDDLNDLSGVLARAAAYVVGFEHEFAAIIWRENYLQEDRMPRTFGASGSRFTQVQRRRLESEMLFVWLENEATWLTVRDVLSVDDKPVPASERRLPSLLAAGSMTIAQLRSLSDENGRFNIGAIARNFNEPTLALLFLDDHYRARFRFSRAGTDTVDGASVWKVDFVEQTRPTVIRRGSRDVQSTGRLWIEPASGRVLRTLLVINEDLTGASGRITVSYRPDARLAMLVPVEMHEAYNYISSTTPHAPIECTATYSDFRRFETSGRLIIPKQ